MRTNFVLPWAGWKGNLVIVIPRHSSGTHLDPVWCEQLSIEVLNHWELSAVNHSLSTSVLSTRTSKCSVQKILLSGWCKYYGVSWWWIWMLEWDSLLVNLTHDGWGIDQDKLFGSRHWNYILSCLMNQMTHLISAKQAPLLTHSWPKLFEYFLL